MRVNKPFLCMMTGIYLVTSTVSVYCMYRVRDKKNTPNKVVVGISVSLFVIITAVSAELLCNALTCLLTRSNVSFMCSV